MVCVSGEDSSFGGRSHMANDARMPLPVFWACFPMSLFLPSLSLSLIDAVGLAQRSLLFYTLQTKRQMTTSTQLRVAS